GARSEAAPSPMSPAATLTRPTTPTSPVQIPLRSKAYATAHPQNQNRHFTEHKTQRSSRPRDVHSPDAIPPSVAALLAVTSIPMRGSRSMRIKASTDKRLTVEAIIEHSQESEKELSLRLSKSPLDLLLMAPEDLEVDDVSICESVISAGESVLSARTVSFESMPSLDDSFSTTFSSLDAPYTPERRRKSQVTRMSLEPVSSPPGGKHDHPLFSPDLPVDDMDFRVFDKTISESPGKRTSLLQFSPLKSAFKSNLTASLRALRQAARSFSTINFPSIPPEDFLTRSILTIDPQVPYTDERRPPPLEEEPTAALRRYLNPTTSARLEQPRTISPAFRARAFTASIQMQTYKVQRSRSAPPAARTPYGPGGSSSQTSPSPKPPLEYPMPSPRQREMRENSDFIRIAVMEMAMRKRGKLDDQRPGRARWALPPRKASTTPYQVGADGVPARWVSI
ncbi:hypothetical protein GQ53DRAFT_601760, partial [Thozetella sp. PMI_491]